MEEQKVFATAWRGFDKKAVLDYIYEQDVRFKKKEAEWNEQQASYEAKLEGQSSFEEGEESPEGYRQRIEELEQACNEERETALSLQEKLDRAHRDADQMIQAARSKEGELQLQLELNRQLQQKCEVLQDKLATLAQRLMADRDSSVHITAPSVTVVEARQQPPARPVAAKSALEISTEADSSTPPKAQFSSLKGELTDFRQSVSRTLLGFEAALAQLEGEQPQEAVPSEGSDFFR